ncbi:unnamed protein product [Urochloa decumbens]|uniref:Uncharacterized protein n=1 Tax=Urochloa decumbens TaxID=240449 RepID=A0ABC9DL01_9POAL
MKFPKTRKKRRKDKKEASKTQSRDLVGGSEGRKGKGDDDDKQLAVAIRQAKPRAPKKAKAHHGPPRRRLPDPPPPARRGSMEQQSAGPDRSDAPAGECEWREELRQQQSQVDALRERLVEVKVGMRCSEGDSRRELDHLCRRVKTIATLLAYLKSKARIMAIPHLAHTSCGIRLQEGVGYIDRHGVPLADWPKGAGPGSCGGSSGEDRMVVEGGAATEHGDAVGGDVDVDDILKSIRVVTDVMESLVKRVIVAESEATNEKEKFAVGTNGMLNEMRQRVEDMVLETTRQRQRAAENEQELSRVKQDFESLRTYVSTLVSVRETLLSSEKQFETMEKLFDRLVAKTNQLETEKAQKEAEVQKVMEENVRLRAMLDKKEAQLQAMSEQCKFMALNHHN